ncbi:phosphoribosylanthranilate isomerase [Pseudalkalibacillus decolorationis]|uniref:phosphoribosylanthranilate isomerase n=1 Tax=Pseudalkalibacillus decolorationis TaxID=163879 RepID=UPI00214743BA|nr:phosphoribosylanthranilate isomerase [Pseudalkalibacillus decolorationis]
MSAIKVCGVRTVEDYELIVQGDIDYVGFVFAPSKRQVTPEHICSVVSDSKVQSNIHHVAVFVNPTIQEIIRVCKMVKIDVIQLHGNEQNELIDQIRAQKLDIEIWKAIPHSENTSAMMKEYASFVDGFVIDTKIDGKSGGTGCRFDWQSIPSYKELAKLLQKRCFIAGGITPDNISECLSYGPDGIDLSSGIEKGSSKDPTLFNLLIERMRNYGNNDSE